MDKRKSFKTLHEVFFALCKSIGTPRSLGAWLRFKYRQYDDLVSLDISPRDYLDANSFMVDYAVVSYLSKTKVLKTGYNRRKRAIDKFLEAERICKDTNTRFRASASTDVAFGGVLHSAKRKIADILGPLCILDCVQASKWGPGATFDLPRSSSGSDYKNSVTLSVTHGALPYGRALLESDPVWFRAISGHDVGGRFSALENCFSVVPGNRVVMVPKNAKIDRVIACEPTLNSFVQQGVGRHIRCRLKHFGVDLDNQEINQTWASLAHRLDLATLDLSMASDTIARELVFSLLPLDWALFLDSLRSKRYVSPVDGSWCDYQKFSSMGNAFTFELESLIFFALAKSVCEAEGFESSPCSVYGDDLIVPQGASYALIEVLEYCGFRTNVQKSYVSGMFFESCGKHFFGDSDVTPVYQKENLHGPEAIRAWNRLIRFGIRHAMGHGISSIVQGACRAIARLVPNITRYRIPIGTESDDGLLCPSSEWSGTNFVPGRGWHCKVLCTRPVRRRVIDAGELAHTLRVLGDLDQVVLPLPVALVRNSHGFVLRFLSGKAGTKDTGSTRVKPGKRWIIPQEGYDLDWI